MRLFKVNLSYMDVIILKSRNKFHYIPSFGGVWGGFIKKIFIS